MYYNFQRVYPSAGFRFAGPAKQGWAGRLCTAGDNPLTDWQKGKSICIKKVF
jgi:hypothetical protein